MRKTYDVAEMVKTANAYMANSNDDATGFREGVAVMLESVLMATGNYRGFRYLASEFLPAEEQTLDNVLVDNYDDTRRRYI